MPKKHSFSIYLLKDDYEPNNCFVEGTELELAEDAGSLPQGAFLYIMNAVSKHAWWRAYFEIQRNLFQSLKGAILLVPVGDRWFALTFGNVAHNLIDTAYEHDFGMQVTLNCLDPEKIKNTDTLNPSSSIRQRTQAPGDADFSDFGFDRYTTIVKSLTGKVKEEYKDIITSATGSSHLRISTDVTSEEIPELCEDLIELYESEEYLDVFPGIDNIMPVRDPEKIQELNNILLNSIMEEEEVGLVVPDMIDYREAVYVRFGGAGGARSHPEGEVRFANYIEYVTERGINLEDLDLETLKRHHLYLCDDDGVRRDKNYSILKSIIFNTQLPGEDDEYHLSEGAWYKVDGDYLNHLCARIDDAWSENTLPNYDHPNEGEYNESLVGQADVIACLDRANISPQGERQVEPCDLVRLNQGGLELIHVKRSTQSNALSHLFNQGVNSAILLQTVEFSRARINQLIAERADEDIDDDWSEKISASDFVVRYAIISHKPQEARSRNLPLFSRISLYRNLVDLESRRFRAVFEFVFDQQA